MFHTKIWLSVFSNLPDMKYDICQYCNQIGGSPIPRCHMSATKHHLRNYISGYIFCKNCIVSWNMMQSDQSVSNWTHESTKVAYFPHNLMAADATYTLVWFYWGKHTFKCRKNFCQFRAYFPVLTLIYQGQQLWESKKRPSLMCELFYHGHG